MKGILLAGGSGTRLYPLTLAVSKHLLPIYDKPMIYYPLSVLLLADIRDILLICAPPDQESFQRLLGDGSQWGIRLSYANQIRPTGVADALRIARDFIAGARCCLILGDNLFFGHGLPERLRRAARQTTGATVFAHHVLDPRHYGVVELAPDGKALSIEEKPIQPRSHYALTGLYFYDAEAAALAAQLQPSARGELEISDLNRLYLERGWLTVEILGRGFTWLDVGSPDRLLQASQLIQSIEQRQGLKLACLEEIALARGFIEPEAVRLLAQKLCHTDYGGYLMQVISSGTHP